MPRCANATWRRPKPPAPKRCASRLVAGRRRAPAPHRGGEGPGAARRQPATAARAAQVNAALNEASSALQSERYEAAIAAYERALALILAAPAAQTGRQAAIGSKSLADAAAFSAARAPGADPSRASSRGGPKRKRASAGFVGFELGPVRQAGHAAPHRPPRQHRVRGDAGAEAGRAVQGGRLPFERGLAADSPHGNDRGDYPRRQGTKRRRSARHGHGGPGRAIRRLPGGESRVEGRHAILEHGVSARRNETYRNTLTGSQTRPSAGLSEGP